DRPRQLFGRRDTSRPWPRRERGQYRSQGPARRVAAPGPAPRWRTEGIDFAGDPHVRRGNIIRAPTTYSSLLLLMLCTHRYMSVVRRVVPGGPAAMAPLPTTTDHVRVESRSSCRAYHNTDALRAYMRAKCGSRAAASRACTRDTKSAVKP